jgi:hypothetical protein
MGFVRTISRSNFYIKLRSWEYWPFGIIQAPLFAYWLLLSLRLRSLFFFSASNPGIFMGGMFGESKFDVLKKIPDAVKPKTILIKYPETPDQVLLKLKENNLSFPVIFKPDLGERGWMVKRINQESDVHTYLLKIRNDFLVQELVDLPMEFGVFYVRNPKEENGKVISIVGKEMLFVTGDGRRTLQELILENDRAKLQWLVLREKLKDRLKDILPEGKKLELISIGNHCLGTKFINCNSLINEKLSASFDQISKQVEGFYFGRYDLRVLSVEDLENGRVKILELNGCGAEPAHIYHPGFPLTTAFGVLFRHWTYIYQISAANHAAGTPFISFQDGWLAFKKFKSIRR